ALPLSASARCNATRWARAHARAAKVPRHWVGGKGVVEHLILVLFQIDTGSRRPHHGAPGGTAAALAAIGERTPSKPALASEGSGALFPFSGFLLRRLQNCRRLVATRACALLYAPLHALLDHDALPSPTIPDSSWPLGLCRCNLGQE